MSNTVERTKEKSDYTGLGSVFRFTFIQFFKGKGNIVSMIITLLIVMGMVPFSAIMSKSNEPSNCSISKVYVCNQTQLPISASDYEDIATSDLFKDVAFVDSSFNEDSFIESLGDDKTPLMGPSEALISIKETVIDGESTYSVTSYSVESPEYDDNSLNLVISLSEEILKNARLVTLNVSEEQLQAVTANIESSSMSIKKFETKRDDDEIMSQYLIQLVFDIVIMMICIITVSYIVKSVVEEKSNKLVEQLMVSVKPLALIWGKILACIVYVIFFVAIIICGYLLSTVICSHLGITGGSLIPSGAGLSFGNITITIPAVLCGIISLAIGLISFSILAGLSGAGCSTTEDEQGANSLTTMIIMICYFVSLGATFMGANQAFAYTASLLPFLSVFVAPIEYLMGNIPIWVLILSWVIQGAVAFYLAKLCSSIYEGLLTYRGQRLKFTDMLKMSKQVKIANSKEENTNE